MYIHRYFIFDKEYNLKSTKKSDPILSTIWVYLEIYISTKIYNLYTIYMYFSKCQYVFMHVGIYRMLEVKYKGVYVLKYIFYT